MSPDRMTTTYELLSAPRVRGAIRSELEARGVAADALERAICDVITHAFVSLEASGTRVEDEDFMCILVREALAEFLGEAANPQASEPAAVDSTLAPPTLPSRVDEDALAFAVVESSRSPFRAARPVVD